MSSQNILNYYGSKLDVKVDVFKGFYQEIDKEDKIDLIIDTSEQYDVFLDKTDYIDLLIDYSENYDVQLDSTDELYYPKELKSIDFSTRFVILTMDGYTITTQNGEYIQYQY
jgi:hypothetical protein